MKIILDTDTGKATMEKDGKIVEDFTCYDFKFQSSHSESRFHYWPNSKKERKIAREIYKNTGTKRKLTDKNKLAVEIGDKVSLPFNETGILVEILDILWGFDHIVKIVKGTFNGTNQLVEYKKEQLKLEN